METILERVDSPTDLKRLSRPELVGLADEIREQLLIRLSAAGGHVGSNLAVIEATVALHRVFDSPTDKIVFDASHQCYTHKLLTVFEEVKDFGHPVVVHICTVKGKGYRFAEENRENWHYMSPFDRETGRPLHVPEAQETYENLTRDFLREKMAKCPAIAAITIGTPKVLGFDEALRKQFPQQFIDWASRRNKPWRSHPASPKTAAGRCSASAVRSCKELTISSPTTWR